MGFLIFAPSAFVILWLAFRLRVRTSVWMALIIGLVCDFLLDLLVARRQ
jgi:cell shape-determining protein MreD